LEVKNAAAKNLEIKAELSSDIVYLFDI